MICHGFLLQLFAHNLYNPFIFNKYFPDRAPKIINDIFR